MISQNAGMLCQGSLLPNKYCLNFRQASFDSCDSKLQIQAVFLGFSKLCDKGRLVLYQQCNRLRKTTVVLSAHRS